MKKDEKFVKEKDGIIYYVGDISATFVYENKSVIVNRSYETPETDYEMGKHILRVSVIKGKFSYEFIENRRGNFETELKKYFRNNNSEIRNFKWLGDNMIDFEAKKDDAFKPFVFVHNLFDPGYCQDLIDSVSCEEIYKLFIREHQ